MNNWVASIYGSFERLLRWVYPGILFFVLLFVSRPDSFNEVSGRIGFPGTLWPLVIGSLGIGAVVYILQIYVVGQFLALLAQCSNWDFGNSTGVRDKNGRPVPKCRALKRLSDKIIDPQAEHIERQHPVQEKRLKYLTSLWAGFHATSITGWLTLIFALNRQTDLVPSWVWRTVVISSAAGALYLFLRLTRVREYRWPAGPPSKGTQ